MARAAGQKFISGLRFLRLLLECAWAAGGNLHILKGEMTCQREANGNAYGSWDFYVNGSKALHFDSKNGNGTVLSP
ncbi:UL16-binding protein 1-like isoform X2 [Pteropus medius]|uniref:UL16-binding protein 1-like isoform X2 n=1 Tax=Pteropus vampyrus TaxID=132908 RepID=UPI00196A66DD|nr:UL16-binding protein 1-like isoform X2 [Pteropus giganteus]